MIDNYNDFKKMLDEIKKEKIKPSLLLHSCCAPCSTHVLKMLTEVFDVTILYYNPNIYPQEEFIKRLTEQQKLISLLNKDIKIIEGFYDYNIYKEEVKGLENLGERSKRCYNCYFFRLEATAKFAKENNYDYFTTTLSISPYKNSDWINEIGNKFTSAKCKYLYSNFKKENGYKNSITLAKEYNLYRQDYCGCEFSIKEHEELLKRKNSL